MQVLEPLQSPWEPAPEGGQTRCTVHNVTFDPEESCPVGGCFGAGAEVEKDDGAAEQLDLDEQKYRARAALWFGVADTLIAKAFLRQGKPGPFPVGQLALATHAELAARRSLAEAVKLCVIRAKRQKVNTLRRERTKSRRRRAH